MRNKGKIFKKDLKEGSILPIYLNFKKQENCRGNAILIKRLKEREPPHDQKQFEFSEIGDKYNIRSYEKVQIVYNWQWWRIKFVDGPEKGFETAVKIAYYQSTFWQKYNNDDEDNIL